MGRTGWGPARYRPGIQDSRTMGRSASHRPRCLSVGIGAFPLVVTAAPVPVLPFPSQLSPPLPMRKWREAPGVFAASSHSELPSFLCSFFQSERVAPISLVLLCCSTTLQRGARQFNHGSETVSTVSRRRHTVETVCGDLSRLSCHRDESQCW